mmetsp:Transcript_19688/g.45287  ORF Transcript_19688/g.45287 Transcript_19688/m.45287 type:complete len:108 (-) Transcript_19688:308-631(-)
MIGVWADGEYYYLGGGGGRGGGRGGLFGGFGGFDDDVWSGAACWRTKSIAAQGRENHARSVFTKVLRETNIPAKDKGVLVPHILTPGVISCCFLRTTRMPLDSHIAC